MNHFLGIARKVWCAVFTLALVNTATYILPVYIVAWQDGYTQKIGLDAHQYKMVLFVYGLICLPCNLLSGWLTDKFNPKKLMIGSLIMTGSVGIWFAGVQLLIYHHYSSDIILINYYIIFSLWGFSTVGLFWCPLWKIMHQITSEDLPNTAKINGLNTAFAGLVPVAFAGLATIFFKVGDIKLVGFVANNFLGYLLLALTPFLGAMLVQWHIPSTATHYDKFTLQDAWQVFKNPMVILISFLMLSGYIFQSGVRLYSSAIFNNHLRAPWLLFFILMLMFTYLTRFFISPLIGKWADKAHSYTLCMLISIYMIGIIQIMILLVNTVFIPQRLLDIPYGSAWWSALIVINTIIYIMLGFVVWAFVTLRWTLITEIGLKKAHIGSAIGIISMIGYSSDAWMSLILSQISKHNYIYDLTYFKQIDNQIGFQQIMFIIIMFSAMFSLAGGLLYYLLWKQKYQQFYQTKIDQHQPIHWLTKWVLRKYIKHHHLKQKC